MDDTRFDAWTRRRFGLEIGGAMAALAGFTAPRHAQGKQRKARRRRKRCLKKNDFCTMGGQRRCCKDLRCDFPAAVSMATHCCGRAGTTCDEDFDCCVDFLCNLERGRCETP